MRRSPLRLTGDPLRDSDAVLTSVGIPHVWSGSLALVWYGTQRGTKDYDVVVHAPDHKIHALVRAVESVGIRLDRRRFYRDLEKRGYAGIPFPQPGGRPFIVEMIRAGVGLPRYFDQGALRRSRLLPLEGRLYRVISAEDLVVAKLIFWRDKDRPDIENMLRAGTVNPRAVIRRLREMIEPGDPYLGEREAWFRSAVARWHRPRRMR
jgi:hypothetical protein